jgi:transglutaminase-like putative cysteine protease
MSATHKQAAVAGTATVLCALALNSVFSDGGWIPPVVLAVATVTAAGMALRAVGAPLWLQPLAQSAALVSALALVFGPGGSVSGRTPTPGTLAALADLTAAGFRDVAELSAPVPTRGGLLLVTAAGVGLVAVVVDLLAAGMGRAALAGMPLLSLYAVPVAIHADRVGWYWFALGAGGYLWLLRTDSAERARRWGHLVRPSAGATEPPGSGAPTGGTGLVLTGVALVVAVALPGLLPDLSAAALFTTGEGTGIGRGSHDARTVNPITRLRGELIRRETVELLRVRTDDDDPFYLRLTALDVFRRSDGWSQSPLEATVEQRVALGIPPDPDLPPDMAGRTVSTSVEIRGFRSSRYLPVYTHLQNLTVGGDWRYDTDSQTVFSTRTDTQDFRYGLTSTEVDYRPESLAASAPLPAGSPVQERFGRVPSDPVVEEIVRDIVAGASTPYEKALALNTYFSPANGFRYSLRTRPGTTGDDLLDFLENKEGYCEQYASALAYLARQAGLPARVAIGFTRGERRGGYWSITSRDAHAWTEIYFDRVGWVPFDPTPLGGGGHAVSLPHTLPPSAAGGTAADPNATSAPASPGSTPSTGPGTRRPDRERELGQGAAAPTGSGTGPAGESRWPALASVALLLALVSAPAAARVVARRRRHGIVAGTDPVGAAHAAWDEVLATLTDFGLSANDAETPRATAARVAERDGLDDTSRTALRQLATAEERARYATTALQSSGLAQALDTVRSGLWADADRRTAVSAILLPASATVAGAEWLATASENVSQWLAQLRPSAGRR